MRLVSVLRGGARRSGDADAGAVDLVAAVHEDQRRGQRLGHGRIGDHTGMPGLHAGIFGEPDDDLPGLRIVAADQDVAVDGMVEIGQVRRRHVLEGGDHPDVLAELVLRRLGAGAAFRWSDKTATNLSKMILLKQYSREKWEQYWKKKLGIKGYFNIQIQSLKLSPCKHF